MLEGPHSYRSATVATGFYIKLDHKHDNGTARFYDGVHLLRG